MADNKFTLKLTQDQQKQIREATGKDVTELRIGLAAKSDLTEADLEQVAGGLENGRFKRAELPD